MVDLIGACSNLASNRAAVLNLLAPAESQALRALEDGVTSDAPPADAKLILDGDELEGGSPIGA